MLLDGRVASSSIAARAARPAQARVAQGSCSGHGQREYEVQWIVSHRGEPGSYEYQVKWKNYNERTWEPASSFHDDLVIKNYWKARDGQHGRPVVPD